MMPHMGNRWWLPALLAVATSAAACAPVVDESTSSGTQNCRKDSLSTLYPGIFTVGTDQPAYPPWYMGDDPTNGEGFESALAFAVAGNLGYTPDEVRWVRVPFNGALEPGLKTFDANLSQFSITDQRRASVDFSSPYFDVTQVVVTTDTSPAAQVQSIGDLTKTQLGVQVGTTSHTAAIAIAGDVPVEVYNTNADAKVALSNGEIDALVADLPTAYTVAGELRGGKIVGQLPADPEDVEQFGIVLDKDSPLTRCVSSAVDGLRSDGTLARLERQWLSDAGRVPVLR
ncbi:amino acid ABC transporter substrate-binding protein [Mycolicibacterium tusciae]|jgi:polar amino acid transport system substrate-binding protein|uniref:Amino acid ABC transporter substrate-binding protein n=2 Tax=Mycolicibacterium tusciae TaxID=75922 RepID=A0A1X0JF04_9MYCO|nr:amino acid ABC transporter substrate-binding protein [Mycolicibacterium tusciae]